MWDTSHDKCAKIHQPPHSGEPNKLSTVFNAGRHRAASHWSRDRSKILLTLVSIVIANWNLTRKLLTIEVIHGIRPNSHPVRINAYLVCIHYAMYVDDSFDSKIGVFFFSFFFLELARVPSA